MKTLVLSIGKTPFRLTAMIIQAGKDIQICLGGGVSPHIGSVAISQPRPSLKNPDQISCTTSVINFPGHKDDRPAVLFSEGFCKRYNCLTVVSAGIHIDDADPQQIERIMNLAEKLLEGSLEKWHHMPI